MATQYRLPEATSILQRRLEHLYRTGADFSIVQRREGSPWVLVKVADR